MTQFSIAKFQGQDEQEVGFEVRDLSGGENNRADAANIGENQATKLLNIDISVPGQRTKRKGYTLFADDKGTVKVNSLKAFASTPGGAQKLYMSSNGSVYEAETGDSAWGAAIIGSLTNTDSEMVVAGSLLFIFNQTDNVRSWNGSSATDEGNTNADPPKAKVGTYFQNRLFLANTSTNPDWVYFSNALDPQTFDRTVQVFKVETGENDQITALVGFRQSRELYIFKEDSIHKLVCEGPYSNWYLVDVDLQHGCVAKRSIAVAGNDIIFLSRDGVRSLSTTQFNIAQGVDLPLSYNMKTIWDSRNDSVISGAAGVYYNNKYYISIPTGSSTVNDTTMVYNVATRGWAHWTGPDVAVWAVWVESGAENLYFGDMNGDTKVYRAENGYVDVATAITYQEESKEYDFGAPLNWKVLKTLSIKVKSAGSYYLDTFVNLDEEGWQQIGTVPLTGAALTLPQTLPFPLEPENITTYTFNLESLGKFKRAKFKFVEDDSTSDEIKLYSYEVRAFIEPFEH